jgi:hypothetical protein
MLFITTSNGVLRVDSDSHQISVVMTNKHTPGFFKKKARGYFGICFNSISNKIIVASREKLGTKKVDKPATDTKLHEIDPVNLSHKTLAVIHDIHDVHQIACHNNYVYLTDTGKNQVPVYSLEHKRITTIFNIGEQRRDINHVNAVTCYNERLYIGLNNRGIKESEIISLPFLKIETATNGSILFDTIADRRSIPGIHHSHDLEPFNDIFLMCASHDGLLIRSDNGQAITEIGDWTRGITISDKDIWVSASQYAKRSKRHSNNLDGYLYRIDKNSFEILDKIIIPNAGQMNDMICLN